MDINIVINGNECELEKDIPSFCNVIKRENKGYDFGGHKAALDSKKKNMILYIFKFGSFWTYFTYIFSKKYTLDEYFYI